MPAITTRSSLEYSKKNPYKWHAYGTKQADSQWSILYETLQG